MLSFTLAHAAVIQMRRKMPESDMPWRGPLSYHVGGYDLPLFAVLGLIGTLASWLVTIVLHFVDGVAPVGGIWLVVGLVVYTLYRKSQHLPLTETVMMPQSSLGPALEVEYRSILMPLSKHRVSDEMTATAPRLAAESGAHLVALYPIEVPLDRSISDAMSDQVEEAERELRETAALGDEYGVTVITRIVRTRNAGQAIVDEAERRRSEIIVMGASDRKQRRRADVREGDRLRPAKRPLPRDGRHRRDGAHDDALMLRANHRLRRGLPRARRRDPDRDHRGVGPARVRAVGGLHLLGGLPALGIMRWRALHPRQ